ncbi:hypothetical protein AGMMS49975_27190 [Clostridia bacterium]|nr:hypothetical protein AGMMS49975_27190 [Clostridia bacterium]
MLGKEILDKQKQTPYGAFNAFLEAYKRRDFEAADSLLCKDLGTAFFNPDIDPESLSETDKTVIYLITENLTADVLKADYTGDMPLLTVHIKNNDVYNLVLETSNIIYGDTKLQELTESGGTEVANARLAELIAQTLDYLQNAKDLPVIDELIDVSVHLADGEYRVVMTPDLCSCLTGFYVDLLNDLNNITNEHQNQNK